MPSKDLNQLQQARDAAKIASSEELAKATPYQGKPTPKRTKTLSPQEALRKAQDQIADLRSQMKEQKASRPTIRADEEEVALVYQAHYREGTREVKDYLVKDPQLARSLHALIRPLVDLCAHALKDERLSPRPAITGQGDEAMKLILKADRATELKRATALTRAQWAYQQMASDPTLKDLLMQVSDRLEELFIERQKPGNMRLFYEEKDGTITPVWNEGDYLTKSQLAERREKEEVDVVHSERSEPEIP